MAINLALVLLAATGMELVAWFAHKYVMHGWGWKWHRSHHETGPGWFETNDLYALVFAAIAIALIAIGTQGTSRLEWIGAGMTLYGALYFIVHDGLVHKRWPLRWIPRRGYFKRLYQAHRLHHAVRGRDGGVSFSFLWAPSPLKITQTLREKRNRGRSA